MRIQSLLNALVLAATGRLLNTLATTICQCNDTALCTVMQCYNVINMYYLLLQFVLCWFTYRFSIEWSKIEPSQGTIDAAAVAHYHQEIDILLRQGIMPMVYLSSHYSLCMHAHIELKHCSSSCIKA
jgi:Glycosyl hydrolase family 1